MQGCRARLSRWLERRIHPTRGAGPADQVSTTDRSVPVQGPLLDPGPADVAAARPNDLGGRCIILASHGRTGTNWIMRALNAHPEFFCTHAGLATEYDPVTRKTRPPRELAPLEPHVSRMTVDEYFGHLIRYRRAKHYVSSHNFQVNTIAHGFRTHPPRRRYVVVNLTRHPIVRVRSFVARMLYEDTLEPNRTSRRDHTYAILRDTAVAELVAAVERGFGVDVRDYSSACFLASLWTIMVETAELDEAVLHVPMERLVVDPDYFGWFVWRITEGTTRVDSRFVAEVFSRGAMNESGDGQPMLASRIYADLPEWGQFCWQRLVQEKRLPKRYDRFGYDFSFVQ